MIVFSRGARYAACKVYASLNKVKQRRAWLVLKRSPTGITRLPPAFFPLFPSKNFHSTTICNDYMRFKVIGDYLFCFLLKKLIFWIFLKIAQFGTIPRYRALYQVLYQDFLKSRYSANSSWDWGCICREIAQYII